MEEWQRSIITNWHQLLFEKQNFIHMLIVTCITLWATFNSSLIYKHVLNNGYTPLGEILIIVLTVGLPVVRASG